MVVWVVGVGGCSCCWGLVVLVGVLVVGGVGVGWWLWWWMVVVYGGSDGGVL